MVSRVGDTLWAVSNVGGAFLGGSDSLWAVSRVGGIILSAVGGKTKIWRYFVGER